MAHQTDIFVEGAPHHIVLEFVLASDELPPHLPGAQVLAAHEPDVSQVVALGGRAARFVRPSTGAIGFTAIEGDGNCAPATQGDVFVWLHGRRRDEIFAQALAWRDALASCATLAREAHGFVFRDSRDLTGFIDGTANPKGDARQAAALVAQGPHRGGSYVLAQRWVHDLVGFGALPVADQERVIGRTRADSVELEGDAMPPDSHVSRTDLAGTKIYRRSVPVGGVGDAGLFFLAFSAEQDRFARLLGSMFGHSEDGLQDRLLRYSRPVSGSFYFAPSAEQLAAAFGAAA
jgi:putative iron-dependent peroxidase